MKKLLWLIPIFCATTAAASYIPNLGPLQLLDVRGSTMTVGYQGNVSSIPVSVIGTANAQVVTSTLQVQVSNFPASQPVTGTFFQTTQPISGAVSGSGPYSVTAGTGTFTMGFVGATGSTVSASYQGATISSVPVSIQGTANVQVVTSTLQVTGSVEVLTSTLQVTGSMQVVSSTLQVTGAMQVVSSTLQVTGAMSVTASTFQVNVAGLPAITKGTQGATGITTQDLKDAGRTQVTYYVTASTVGATGVESALVFTKASGTSATSSSYTQAITNGKTFRIQSIAIATQGNATATTQTTTFSLRVNTAANCNAGTTPVIWQQRSSTPATTLAWDRPPPYIVPEGWQILGTSTLQICASVNSTFVTNAPTADMIISGYEY